ncbi:MAG: type II toxin-antitoxin system RelE/ParE family toxin [Nitrosospira sp.]|nr:type II toxin-antitoxin system RelE/ParE family toxin [Nitrosospira sp.]
MIELILAVRFFATASGREPARDFLRALTVEDRKTIGTDIKTVQFGWPIGMPLVRKMEPGLWEVRSHIADGIARVQFTVIESEMVLLHAFVKKARKTPATDLETARKRLHQIQRGAR